MQPLTLPSPADIVKRLKESDPGAPPLLPERWEATVLLTPYGDETSALENYRQLVIADVEYDWTYGAMVLDLYLTQSLQVFRFFFLDGAWYWVEIGAGGTPDTLLGPFATTLQVPGPDLLSKSTYGGNWGITGTACNHWVIPTNEPGVPAHGSWFATRRSDDSLYRIFTFDSTNALQLPILGAYYLAHLPTFAPLPAASAKLTALVAAARAGKVEAAPTGFSNPLVTQNDIQSVMAAPLSPPATCTAADLQALIPGFVAAPSGVTLPVWADRTGIFAMTLGTDFIPYVTLVSYFYSYGRQQSVFIGLGQEAGQGSYDDRQDCVLYPTYTNVPQYYLQNGDWAVNCCSRIPNIGVPRPDWVSAAVQAFGGGVAASISGNPDFGLKPDETLNLIDCMMPRDDDVMSLFWVWFNQDQVGVLFSESNYAQSVTAHNLQLIDYLVFVRDADWIDPSSFTDPCAAGTVPPCQPQDAEAGWKVKGPRHVGGPVSRPQPLDA